MPSHNQNLLLDEITHTGPLTMSSLLYSFPRLLFRAARKSQKVTEDTIDPLHLGWEYVPSHNGYKIHIEKLKFATAEGAVTLAALIDCLRVRFNNQVRMDIAPDSRNWSYALQLEQAARIWSVGLPRSYKRVAGSCYVYPLWRWVLDKKDTCLQIANHISIQVSQLLSELKYDFADDVSVATELFAREALINVFEHAYDGYPDRVVFGAVTLTPVPGQDNEHELDYATSEERDWFENLKGRGLMLEVVVADYGRNIPSTLWESFFRERQDVPNPRVKVRLGTNLEGINRALLHHDISLWALNHQSTRKSSQVFPNEYALHNWRGLHRAVNAAARLHGCIVIRSGVARTGYSFYEDKSATLVTPRKKLRDFPGTGVVLRVPILSKPRSSVAHRRTSATKDAAHLIELSKIESIDNAQKALADEHPSKAAFIGIAHPFTHYTSDDIKVLLSKTRAIPPHFIGVHLFAEFNSQTILNDLRAIDSSQESQDWGLPRLTAWWEPEEKLRWKFVGLIPKSVRPMIEHLEENGIAFIHETEFARNYAINLARIYSPYITIEGNNIHLKCFDSGIRDELQVVHEALGIAFTLWSKNSEGDSWLFDYNTTGKYVMLGAGHLVKRYISILRVLYHSDVLTRNLGWMLVQLFNQATPDTGTDKVCVITESLAGHSIINKLLESRSISIPIYINEPPVNDESPKNVIIFADVVYKTAALESLLEKNKKCSQIICCIDLREERSLPVGDQQVPVTSLIPLYFDPEEIKDIPLPNVRDILEVDRITHIPTDAAPVENFLLGTSAERSDFIAANTDVFRYGLHRSGRRIHIATLPVSRLMGKHRGLIFDWLKDEIEQALDRINTGSPIIDVVFFTRTESEIKDLVEALGRNFRSYKRTKCSVFSVALPLVPIGPREIFGRMKPELDLLEGLKSVGTAHLPFELSPKSFIAVYLDDACVTGKTLLDFIRRTSIARRDQQPLLVLAVPMLSRFSPAEEHFYRYIFTELNVPDQPGKRIPFLFRPLFRLQVGSFDMLESTPAYRVISDMSHLRFHLNERLQEYLTKVEGNLRSIASELFASNSTETICQHPFYGGPQINGETVSSRVLHIRHLIALQEQNVGVLSYLLKEVFEACDEDDFSLLMMFASEPSLLSVSPLRSECRPKISQLAQRALENQELSEGLKSDALAVLLLQGTNIIEHTRKAIPLIAENPVLIDQLLTMLLTKAPRTNAWPDDVLEIIDECKGLLDIELYHFLQICIDTYESSTRPKIVNDLLSAKRAIRTLIARTAYHAKPIDLLGKITSRLSSEDTSIKTDGLTMRGLLQDELRSFRDELMPGLEGLIWWAGNKNNQMARVELENSRRELFAAITHLRLHADDIPTDVISEELRKTVEGLHKEVLKHSLNRASHKFLSYSPSAVRGEAPVIERWMPEFFSLPYEVALGIDEEFELGAEFICEWDDSTSIIVAVPIAARHIKRMFELIMQDMKKHGKEETYKIRFTNNRENGVSLLSVQFEDVKREGDEKGTGMSQEEVFMIAERPDVSAKVILPRQMGKTYKLKVVFSDAMYIRWG